MNKTKFSIIIILATIIIVTLTVIVTYNLKSKDNGKAKESESEMTNKSSIAKTNSTNNEQIVETNASEDKISPNASIIFNKYYKQCGHTIKSRENVTEKMVNLTKKDFEKLYSDWQVIKFDKNEIELYKEFEGECNEHYLVKENNEVIAIYQIEKNGDLKLLKNTEIAVNCIPEVDRNNLKEGVTLVGREELNGYLENFE